MIGQIPARCRSATSFGPEATRQRNGFKCTKMTVGLELSQTASAVHLRLAVHSLSSCNLYEEHCSRGLKRGRGVDVAITNIMRNSLSSFVASEGCELNRRQFAGIFDSLNNHKTVKSNQA